MEVSSAQWLEKALGDLCNKMETGLGLDSDMISGLVSYCEFAHPLDAKEYLDNIVGQEAGKTVIDEYLLRRGHSGPTGGAAQDAPAPQLHAYIKPPSEKGPSGATAAKKPMRASKPVASTAGGSKAANRENPGDANATKKKKAVKVVSLAEAAKGSIVFKQGKPCVCQARQHRLVSNCLSCGKIVCEQEGEGPCNFCGALVLMEGSKYAGLDDTLPALSDSEAAAEAYAKRLVDYDRNAAARTTVIDDQSDYYEIEGNTWLSAEEKELLMKKREEIEEEEKAKRSRVVVSFDLVGRKVLINKDEIDEVESESGILRPPEEKEVNRIKPNPTLKIQPIFMDPGPMRKVPTKGSRRPNKSVGSGMRLDITGRVQHESNELKSLMANSHLETDSNTTIWQGPSSSSSGVVNDEMECSLDYR